MAGLKTIEGIIYDPPVGVGDRKPSGYWQNPEMIDLAYDYSKKKHGKVTKAILISDHGSGVYHSIEKIYKKFNNYLEHRGENVNMKRSGFINGNRRKKRKVLNPSAWNEEEIDYSDGKEHWSFKDACDGYKMLRQDSKGPIPQAQYKNYYGLEALKSAVRVGSYLNFQELNEKQMLEERLSR